VLQTLKEFWNPQRLKQLTDVRNIGLYIFAMIVLAITWSGIKTVQNNYELQKQISILKQENAVLHLQNESTYLKNKYLETNQYLELSARQNFGLAAPGETVLLVPKNVAMKYVDTNLGSSAYIAGKTADANQSKTAKNLQDWRDFLLGRKLFEN
jgi:cell division protein FtsB